MDLASSCCHISIKCMQNYLHEQINISLSYADDIALLAETEQDLHNLLDITL